jgi:hypothetical protein
MYRSRSPRRFGSLRRCSMEPTHESRSKHAWQPQLPAARLSLTALAIVPHLKFSVNTPGDCFAQACMASIETLSFVRRPEVMPASTRKRLIRQCHHRADRRSWLLGLGGIFEGSEQVQQEGPFAFFGTISPESKSASDPKCIVTLRRVGCRHRVRKWRNAEMWFSLQPASWLHAIKPAPPPQIPKMFASVSARPVDSVAICTAAPPPDPSAS